jgi:hypothetical protein
MAKLIGKPTWRNLRYYLKHELKKSWKAYAIIGGAALSGVISVAFWVMYLHYQFKTTYGR